MLELFYALLDAVPEVFHSHPGNDLDWPVEALVTIIEVHIGVWIRMSHAIPEPVGQKHRIRVDLQGPIVMFKHTVHEHPLPNPHENFGVECQIPFAPILTVNGAYDLGPNSWRSRAQLDGLAAENGKLIAGEDADLLV